MHPQRLHWCQQTTTMRSLAICQKAEQEYGNQLNLEAEKVEPLVHSTTTPRGILLSQGGQVLGAFTASSTPTLVAYSRRQPNMH